MVPCLCSFFFLRDSWWWLFLLFRSFWFRWEINEESCMFENKFQCSKKGKKGKLSLIYSYWRIYGHLKKGQLISIMAFLNYFDFYLRIHSIFCYFSSSTQTVMSITQKKLFPLVSIVMWLTVWKFHEKENFHRHGLSGLVIKWIFNIIKTRSPSHLHILITPKFLNCYLIIENQLKVVEARQSVMEHLRLLLESPPWTWTWRWI